MSISRVSNSFYQNDRILTSNSVINQIFRSTGLDLTSRIKEIVKFIFYSLTFSLSSSTKKITFLNKKVENGTVTQEAALSSVSHNKILRCFSRVGYKGLSSLTSRKKVLQDLTKDDEKLILLGSILSEKFSFSQKVKQSILSPFHTTFGALSAIQEVIDGIAPKISKYSLVNVFEISKKNEEMNNQYYRNLGKKFIEQNKFETMSDDAFEELLNSFKIVWGEKPLVYENFSKEQKILYDQTKNIFQDEICLKIIFQTLPSEIEYSEVQKSSQPNKWHLKIKFKKSKYNAQITEVGPKLSLLYKKLCLKRKISVEQEPNEPIEVTIEKDQDKVKISFSDSKKSPITSGSLKVKSLTLDLKNQLITINSLSFPSIPLKTLFQIIPGVKWKQ